MFTFKRVTVSGFKRRMLAIRPVDGVLSAKLFRLNAFWFFTLVGLSLPYRLWFARHCDYLRVTTVKETYAEKASTTGSFSSWFTSKASSQPRQPSVNETVATSFRQQMQSLLLYSKDENLPNLLELTNSTVVAKDLAVNGTKLEENEIVPANATTNEFAATLSTAIDVPTIATEEAQNFTIEDAMKGETNGKNISRSETKKETSIESTVDGADMKPAESAEGLQ